MEKKLKYIANETMSEKALKAIKGGAQENLPKDPPLALWGYYHCEEARPFTGKCAYNDQERCQVYCLRARLEGTLG